MGPLPPFTNTKDTKTKSIRYRNEDPENVAVEGSGDPVLIGLKFTYSDDWYGWMQERISAQFSPWTGATFDADKKTV
jgi:hypothetical protein